MFLACLIFAVCLLFIFFANDDEVGAKITYAGLMSLLFFVGVSVVAIDAQSETSFSDSVLLADKWHEESCDPMYDDKGNYAGESCSDVWTFVGIIDGDRREYTVSKAEFKDFPIGAKLQHNYSVGRLGFKHSDEWINPSSRTM